MLVLSRKPGQSLQIGPDIKIIILEPRGHIMRVGIEAPPEVHIARSELLTKENPVPKGRKTND